MPALMKAVSSILPSAFITDLSFSLSDRARLPTQIWPTAIIGLEPAAVTEYQR